MLVMPACDSSLMRLLGSAVKTSASHDNVYIVDSVKTTMALADLFVGCWLAIFQADAHEGWLPDRLNRLTADQHNQLRVPSARVKQDATSKSGTSAV